MMVNRPFQITRRKSASANMQATTERVPRVARLMALAIQFDQLIRDGVVADQADLARLGWVTRARVTQIMDLLHLAPCIQYHLLSSTDAGWPSRRITERSLRRVIAELDWTKQRQIWADLSEHD